MVMVGDLGRNQKYELLITRLSIKAKGRKIEMFDYFVKLAYINITGMEDEAGLST